VKVDVGGTTNVPPHWGHPPIKPIFSRDAWIFAQHVGQRKRIMSDSNPVVGFCHIDLLETTGKSWKDRFSGRDGGEGRKASAGV